MAFAKTATIEGGTTTYTLHPQIKRYTLKDNGFVETPSRNFQFIRSLEATPQNRDGFKLKIVISKDLKTLKMSVTTANGLKAVNIFKNDQHKASQEKLNFLIETLMNNHILVKVEA